MLNIIMLILLLDLLRILSFTILPPKNQKKQNNSFLINSFFLSFFCLFQFSIFQYSNFFHCSFFQVCITRGVGVVRFQSEVRFLPPLPPHLLLTSARCPSLCIAASSSPGLPPVVPPMYSRQLQPQTPSSRPHYV